jgi:hypothetical protein
VPSDGAPIAGFEGRPRTLSFSRKSKSIPQKCSWDTRRPDSLRACPNGNPCAAPDVRIPSPASEHVPSFGLLDTELDGSLFCKSHLCRISGLWTPLERVAGPLPGNEIPRLTQTKPADASGSARFTGLRGMSRGLRAPDRRRSTRVQQRKTWVKVSSRIARRRGEETSLASVPLPRKRGPRKKPPHPFDAPQRTSQATRGGCRTAEGGRTPRSASVPGRSGFTAHGAPL